MVSTTCSRSGLDQRVFDGLGAIDEQAAIEAVLFLGNPVAAAVPADKDDCRCRAARWRFDELHVGIPSGDEPQRSEGREALRRDVFLWANIRRRCRPRDCLTHAANIFPPGYEFEGDRAAIS
jgi:hypothetical protein